MLIIKINEWDFVAAVAKAADARKTQQTSSTQPLHRLRKCLLQATIDPIFRNVILGENNEIKAFSEEQLYSYLLGALTSVGMNAATGEYRNIVLPDGKTVQVQVDKNGNPVETSHNVAQPTSGESNVISPIAAENAPANGTEAGSDFTATSYPNDNGIIPYSATEANNLSSAKGYVNGKDLTFSDFITESKNSNGTKRYYFGKVSQNLSDDIRKATGQDVSGYNVAIRSDEIRHTFTQHGNPQTEALRGQLAVDDSLMAELPKVFNNPDEILLLSKKDYAGRTAFELRKRINGYAIAVNGISNGKHSIEIDSFRVINKKKSPTTSNATQMSPGLTPEAGSRITSTPIISTSSQNSNSGNKIFSPPGLDLSKSVKNVAKNTRRKRYCHME